MACPPGKGQRCPIHNNSFAQNCDGCKKSYQEVCKSCKRLIPPKNLPQDEISLSENPQVDFCQCVASLLSTATDTSSEPMDWDSPRASPHAQHESSGISLTAPSTSRSTALASPQARQSSGISLAEPSTSSATRFHTVESAREAEKFMTFAGAKPKGSKDSGSSKNSPETMACSSDVYPLSSEERYDLRSSKATPRGKKQFRRGPPRKKKTSPEKAKEVKSESSLEGFANFRRTNISTFGKSAENKISSEDEKLNTSGESDYTLKSSTPNGQSYNIRTRRNKYYASPESDNANNDRFYSTNAPPDETQKWSGRQSESYFTSYKENVPFRQGYRPAVPQAFKRQDTPQRLPIPMERHPTFRGRFSGPSPGRSRYQQPNSSSSDSHSGGMGLPRGLKLDEKLESAQKDLRVSEWLRTIEPLSPLSSNETIEEHLVPPTMEAAEGEQQGAVGMDSSNQSAEETSGTEIYDAEEFSKMSESSETDDSKKTRSREK